MTDEPKPKENCLVPTGNKALTTRSSALVKRGLEALVSEPTRIVQFPSDRSMGTLFIHEEGPWLHKDNPSDARGDVTVPNGKRLNLKISEEAAADLSPLASLRPDDLHRLSLRERRQFGDEGLAHLRHLKLLEGLYLQKTQVTDEGLKHIGTLTGLKELMLSETKISDDGLVHLKQLESLKTLALNETQVANEGLAHLGALPNLETLNLAGTQVKDEGMEHLKALGNLKILNLAGTEVTDAGMEYFSPMHRGNPECNLVLLNLDNTKVTDRCFCYFHFLPLRILSLSGAPVGDLELLCAADLQNLEVLDLSHTLITDPKLAFRKNLPTLQVLSFKSTAITDSALPHFHKLTALRLLDLSFTKTTEVGINSLREALPNCRVVVDSSIPLVELMEHVDFLK